MNEDWIKIYTTTKQFNADLIVGMLKEQGIEAVVLNKQDSNYLFGEVGVYVNRENVVLATHIIDQANIE